MLDNTFGLSTVDVAFEEVPEDLSAASVMGKSGDVKIVWDPKKPDDVESARRLFEDLKEKKYLAFRLKGRKGEQGEQVTEFDPKAGRLMLLFVPPMQGG